MPSAMRHKCGRDEPSAVLVDIVPCESLIDIDSTHCDTEQLHCTVSNKSYGPSTEIFTRVCTNVA